MARIYKDLSNSVHRFIFIYKAMFRIVPARLGQSLGQARCMISNMDRAARTSRRVFDAVKDHIPDSKFKRTAEKSFSNIELVREKIRNAGMT